MSITLHQPIPTASMVQALQTSQSTCTFTKKCQMDSTITDLFILIQSMFHDPCEQSMFTYLEAFPSWPQPYCTPTHSCCHGFRRHGPWPNGCGRGTWRTPQWQALVASTRRSWSWWTKSGAGVHICTTYLCMIQLIISNAHYICL